MATISKRASVFAIKEEVTAGTPVVPADGGDFIPLRSGYAMTSAVEEISSDEVVNSFGASKAYAGKETPSGEHPVYLKHSETEGVAPEYSIFLKSALGGQTADSPTEYNTVASSTTSLIKVDTGEGTNYRVGQALLIKDSSNNYSIRNISSISSDDLSINFNLDTAPSAGVDLGKAICFYPTTSNLPTFTAWNYLGNGGAIETISGCRTVSASISANAAQQLEASFSYEGTKYYFNPVVIDATNDDFSIVDDGGTVTGSITQKTYTSLIDLQREIATKISAASTNTITASYDSATGKYLLSSNGTTFSLNCSVANSVFVKVGFGSSDLTGATSYTAATAYDLGAAYTPSYDNAESIIAKSGEIMIGDASDNICRKFSNISIDISASAEDADSICAASGVYEKVPSTREVTVSGTLILNQYETHLFDKFINNTTTSVMVNLGPKSNSNWVAGKCFNLYLGNASITGKTQGGDTFITVDISIKGFVTSSKEDVYINFI